MQATVQDTTTTTTTAPVHYISRLATDDSLSHTTVRAYAGT